MKKNKRILIMIFILLFNICIFAGCMQKNERKKFSSENWDTNIWGREKMIDSLSEMYDLYQMKYDDIVKILGTNGVIKDSRIIYYIGKSFAGPVLFNISFDENDYVCDFGIIVD